MTGIKNTIDYNNGITRGEEFKLDFECYFSWTGQIATLSINHKTLTFLLFINFAMVAA